jgi:putative DNA primase/helicase
VSDDSRQREAALEYSRRGWSVVQLHGMRVDGKTCTCASGPKCKTPGKHPRDTDWASGPAMSEDQIREAWSGWRANHNIGIRTGEPSGFWVLDIDPEKGGDKSAARLAVEHPEMFEPTRCVITGSGGWHYYFAMPDFSVGNSRGRLKDYPGIDIRGTGGQVVAPPSRTDKGGYREATHSVDTIGQAPEWLLDMIRPEERTTPAIDQAEATPVDDLGPAEAKRLHRYYEQARQAEIDRLMKMDEGRQDDLSQYRGEPWDETTFAVACNLLELAYSPWNGYSVEQAYADIVRYAPRDADFDDEQVNVKWESAIKKVDGQGRSMPEAPAAALQSMLDDLQPMVDKIIELDERRVQVMAAHSVEKDSRVAETEGQLKDNDPSLDGFGFGGTTATPPPEREYPRRTWDDIGNGKRMVDHFGDRIRYVAEAESWAVYGGGLWSLVKSNVVVGMCQEMIAERLAQTEAQSYSAVPPAPIGGKEVPSDREAFLSFVAKQRMSARVNAAVAMAAGRPEIYASSNDFDSHSHLLNVRNGVIDLRTGQLAEHDPRLLMMKRAEVNYEPTAPCVEWQKFLDRVMPDAEMQAYLQRIVGYSLTGETISQAFFIHYGAGANGKSVFLQVMRAVIGDYGQTIPRETLLAKKDSEHPTSVARMMGMRFLEVSETAPGRRLDEEAVKNLTGGEKTTARFMGKDFFDFTPTGKIHYVTNHLPLLSDAMSIWRRLHLIRWGVTIPENEQDPRLAERLIEAESAGILAWAVRGAMYWYEQGLNAPQAMHDELAVYRTDSDTFGEFLRERTVPSPNSTTLLKDLFTSYEAWCFSVSIKKPMTRQSFSATLKERGYEVIRQSTGLAFKGLLLVNAKVDTDWAAF